MLLKNTTLKQREKQAILSLRKTQHHKISILPKLIFNLRHVTNKITIKIFFLTDDSEVHMEKETIVARKFEKEDYKETSPTRF